MTLQEFMMKDRHVVEEAMLRGTFDSLAETHSPDIVVHQTPLPEANGLEAYKQAAKMIREGFSNHRIEWGDSVCDGDTIAQRITIYQKHTGVNPMFNVPPTGKEIAVKGIVFLHVKNDKIVEEFDHLDLLGLLQQLGMVPRT